MPDQDSTIPSAPEDQPPTDLPANPKPNRGGRPELYRPEYTEQAARLCELGAQRIDLARAFKVSISTIDKWLAEEEGFSKAVLTAREAWDTRVERSLWERAMGYSFESEKIFMPSGAKEPVRVKTIEHVPPDPKALSFWLRNRQPGKWKEKREVEHSGGVNVESVTNQDVGRWLALLSERQELESVALPVLDVAAAEAVKPVLGKSST